ncbi:hypothetical protein CYY_005182 [Polysphondylium violaceum]|uniref:THAP4-like heme-binding domain-containing protein n=1 Tax=Polysphondylium violaceum TaxID=133409 RepID=A0A8J4PU64_9MYCE|nr:hypothetical protein CYY_005182 [Polysphondylium violaceum]
MSIHPNIEKASWLIGKFRGEGGKGEYPTIPPFTYTEEIDFTAGPPSKPFIHYQQKTWNSKGEPLHTESGYLRFPANGTIEFVNSEPTGVTEIYQGTLTTPHTLTLKLTSIARTPTAKSPNTKDVVRVFEFNPTTQTIHSTMDMATDTTPTLTRHLEITLVKK